MVYILHMCKEETELHGRGRIKRRWHANPQDWQVKETAIPE